MEDHICETPVTGTYVAEHLKKVLGPHAVLKSIKDAKKIAVGQGFVSNILRLELEWEKGSTNDLPCTIIVKVPAVESMHKLMDTLVSGVDENAKMKAMMGQMVTLIHKAECDLYNMFDKNPPIRMPKYYVAMPVGEETPGMIIMEDLSEKGAIPPSYIHGMTYQQALAAITEIARLHAWSLTTSVDWRSQTSSLEDREPMMRGILAPAVAGYKVTKEKYPDEFGSLDLEKMSKLITYESFAGIMNEHREFMDDVLIHGDYHMNNILYEKNKDGTVSDRLLALIDFQGAMRGSPSYDVARLLSFCVSHKIRHDHYDEFVHRYYDEVKSMAGDKFKATYDQIRRLTDRGFAMSSVFMVSAIPTMMYMAVKSEGEQKIKDEKEMIDRMKANYDEGVKILGI